MKRATRQTSLLLAALVLLLLPRLGTASVIPCTGDCGNDERVTVEELVRGVNIALDRIAPSACPAVDRSGDGEITIDELLAAVEKALGGCFDAVVALPGLPAGVEVVYDSLDIPHIYGPDLKSIAYVQGYVHAAHRFWQMDVARRYGEGRLGELVGLAGLTTDVAQRTFLTTRDGHRLEEAKWEQLQATNPALAATVEAYAGGVNAWLADLRAGRNNAALPPEYGFFLINHDAEDLAPWRPQDTIAIVNGSNWGSDSRALNADLGRSVAWAEWPEEVRRDLLRSAPVSEATVLGPAAVVAAGRLAAQVSPALPDTDVLRQLQALLAEVARNARSAQQTDSEATTGWRPSFPQVGLPCLRAIRIGRSPILPTGSSSSWKRAVRRACGRTASRFRALRE